MCRQTKLTHTWRRRTKMVRNISSLIHLRERGTDKVHVFKGSVSRERAPEGARFAAKDGMVKVPKVRKQGIEYLRERYACTGIRGAARLQPNQIPPENARQAPDDQQGLCDERQNDVNRFEAVKGRTSAGSLHAHLDQI